MHGHSCLQGAQFLGGKATGLNTEWQQHAPFLNQRLVAALTGTGRASGQTGRRGELESLQSKHAGWGAGLWVGWGVRGAAGGKEGQEGSRALVRGIGIGCWPRQVTEVWQAGDLHQSRL